MISWIFRYLTLMFFERLFSGGSAAPRMESVRKLKTGTAALTQPLPIGKQCRDPPRQIREDYLESLLKFVLGNFGRFPILRMTDSHRFHYCC